MENNQENIKMNLHQKLVQIRKEVKYVKKEGKGYNFSYATGADLICEIRPKMDELNVILQPNMESFELVEVKKGAGVVTIPKIVVSHTWIDADNPTDRFTTQATYFEDKMTGCQSIGSMMTYAERYFLYKFFQIATGADDIEVIYKENGWEAKDNDKASRQQPQQVKREAEQETRTEISNAKIEMKHVEEACDFCKSVVGDKIEKTDLFRFLMAMSTAYNQSLQKFEAKITNWKNNNEAILKDYGDFNKKFPKPQDGFKHA